MAAIHILRPEDSPIGVMVKARIEHEKGVRVLDSPLDIGVADGLINGVPDAVVGFSLHIWAPKGAVLCKRNRGNNTYFGLTPSPEKSSSPDLEWRQAPIEVRRTRDTGWMYTVWQDRQKDHRISNSVSLWEVDGNHATMWEIGIISPDGMDFYVAHDIRWDGKLFRDEELCIVGVPSDSAYGPWDVREDILDYEPFRALLPDVFPEFCGSSEEIEVPLDLPEPGYAIIEWWHIFMGMGQGGQGVALLNDGTTAWVWGADVEPKAEGVRRLARGTMLSYTGVVQDGQGRRRIMNPCLIA